MTNYLSYENFIIMRIDLPILNNNALRGRGALINPVNRFSNEVRNIEPVYWEDEDEDFNRVKTRYIETFPKTIVNKVDSPDVGLSYSLNPYQGCEHGCVYCYARNTHSYWGYSSGVDFESVILIKKNAAVLLEKLFQKPNYKPAPIMLSGNTDCYQPIEQEMKITRQLLEVMLKYRHPVGIVTKNALILRDLDIIKELNKYKLVNVAISINTLDDELRRLMEPRTSSIPKRLDLVKKLSNAGIPVTVLAAPIIPGLNDNDIMPLVKKVADAGAKWLHHIVVRLNGDLEEIFTNWLENTYPDRKEKVLNKIKSLHGGKLGSTEFGLRMKGEGKIADIIHQQFSMAKRLYLMNEKPFEYNLNSFKQDKALQLSLW